MTDRRIVRLSDSAHRLFVVAMAWSAGNRTDGELTAPDLHLIPGVDPALADELVAAGLWRKNASGWLIVDFELTQTTRAQHEANDRVRAQNRARQQRFRARKVPEGEQNDRDNGREVTRDVTRESTGQARPGQDRTGRTQETHGHEPNTRETTNNGNPHNGADHLTLAARSKWERGYDD